MALIQEVRPLIEKLVKNEITAELLDNFELDLADLAARIAQFEDKLKSDTLQALIKDRAWKVNFKIPENCTSTSCPLI